MEFLYILNNFFTAIETMDFLKSPLFATFVFFILLPIVIYGVIDLINTVSLSCKGEELFKIKNFFPILSFECSLIPIVAFIDLSIVCLIYIAELIILFQKDSIVLLPFFFFGIFCIVLSFKINHFIVNLGIPSCDKEVRKRLCEEDYIEWRVYLAKNRLQEKKAYEQYKLIKESKKHEEAQLEERIKQRLIQEGLEEMIDENQKEIKQKYEKLMKESKE